MDKEIILLETEEKEVELDGVVYIEKTTYRVYSDGSKVQACSVLYPKLTEEETVPPMTQLDRIEAKTTAILENASALDVLLGV